MAWDCCGMMCRSRFATRLRKLLFGQSIPGMNVATLAAVACCSWLSSAVGVIARARRAASVKFLWRREGGSKCRFGTC